MKKEGNYLKYSMSKSINSKGGEEVTGYERDQDKNDKTCDKAGMKRRGEKYKKKRDSKWVEW